MYSASSSPLNLLFNSLPFPSRRPYFLPNSLSHLLLPFSGLPASSPSPSFINQYFFGGKGRLGEKFFTLFHRQVCLCACVMKMFSYTQVRQCTVDSTFTLQQTLKHKPAERYPFILFPDFRQFLDFFWISLHLFCWCGMFKVFITQLIYKRQGQYLLQPNLRANDSFTTVSTTFKM